MPALSTNHVLVVDDEEGIRELLRRMLVPAGYVVQMAHDAESALALLAGFRPAVVIIDIHMPGRSGLWLADQVRLASPHAAMILATADADVPASASFKPGIIEYIVKPLDKATVLKAVIEAREWSARSSGVPFEEEDESSSAGRWREGVAGLLARRGLWVTVLAVVVVLGAVSVYLRFPRVDTVRLVSSASGVVRVFDQAGGNLAQGSGFFVEPDVFITDHHVIDGGIQATVTVGGNVTIPIAGVLAVDRVHDLVALQTVRPGPAQLALATAEPQIGDAVSVYGAPLGLSGTLSTGIVSAAPDANQNRLQISAPISPGSSGSPVMTPSGEVIGVVTAIQITGQAINFAAPVRFVRALLASRGAVQPLARMARGAADDRERNELMGPVKLVTTYSPESLTTRRGRLVAEYGRTMRPSEAERRGDREALLEAWTRLRFDQIGQLVEKAFADDRTAVRYFYDDNKRLETESGFEGDTLLYTWRFVPVDASRTRATDLHGGGIPELAYDQRGRLVEERAQTGDAPAVIRRWHYEEARWPHLVVDGTPEPVVELDVLGNIIKRVESDGSETTWVYRFDARGNWVNRTTMKGAQVLMLERRDITYWK